MSTITRQNLLSLLLITLAGSALYLKTLHIPWIFDDMQNIVDNHTIRDLGLAFSNVIKPRGVAFLSFALNYRFGELDVAGYHVVNIGIHITASWLVFLIARRVFRGSFLLPLATALIFLAHPIQTQAVNYIVQRMASMCGLFLFLSVYGFIRAKEAVGKGKPFVSGEHLSWYLVSLAACVVALWTKQNAVVLPLALLLIERFFLNDAKKGWRRQLLYLLPFILVTVWNTYLQVGTDEKILFNHAARAEYWAKAKETSAVAPSSDGVKLVKPPENLRMLYLVTEFSVLWLYMRLLVLPYGQIFDYGYPLAQAVLTPQNAVAFLGLVALAAFAWYLRARRPLISFGIAWFFLSLLVESTFIPLDAAVEHRLYMAVFGFAVIVLDLLKNLPRRLLVAAVTAGIIVYSGLTWQRNALWSDTIAFARDNVQKAPANQRNYLTLATAYADRGRWTEAENTLRAAIKVRPDHHVPYENLGSALVQQGRLREALFYYRMALSLTPEYPNALYNMGVVLIQLGDQTRARDASDRLKALNSPLAGELEKLLGAPAVGG
ncbi:tetratricopeptide repeat protein [Geobacter sp. DSM 9736]|uniref:tetratricopeptide repeat protein n=1 Tax=Geobacter sp. DSM 9736 TaxID=1277350 RepID=UPI000B50C84D|nr:tetratricopeptide repeat protein [Geobacter sp. DSM 9736]SNB46635.1 Tetratricopeptide repeat-containing protein [Geobacter sp. DSM 9736]